MRNEVDSIGVIKLPDNALYGAQSERANLNFNISGSSIHPVFIQTYLILKKAAAITNKKILKLDQNNADLIIKAIDEILEKNLYMDQKNIFIVDTYQAGAGTSENMNINEVIANYANFLIGNPYGTYSPIHPNDAVNMSQSTNDTYPTVMRLTTLKLSMKLSRELFQLSVAFKKKEDEFNVVLKAGRTHLQDAVPMRLGQEFSGYKTTLEKLFILLDQSQKSLRLLSIGGSAIGSSINVPKDFCKIILEELKILLQDEFLFNEINLFEATQSQLPMMIYSNVLRAIALELTRITNDLRLLSSGPQTGLGEINLPYTQAGSSIMPGKINPSILEMCNQVFFKVLGNDQSMAFAMQAGQLELNVMMPLMAHLALESTEILTNALIKLRTLCIDGITANIERCEKYAYTTTQIVTVLSPILGYSQSAEIAKMAIKEKKTIIDIIREKNLIPESKLLELLDVIKLTEAH